MSAYIKTVANKYLRRGVYVYVHKSGTAYTSPADLAAHSNAEMQLILQEPHTLCSTHATPETCIVDGRWPWYVEPKPLNAWQRVLRFVRREKWRVGL